MGSAPLEEFLVASSRLISSISELSTFSERGVGPAAWGVLKALEVEAVSVEQLAVRTCLSRQRVRVHIRELEAKGLLTVERMEGGDGRVRVVRLSPDGADTLMDVSMSLQRMSGKLNGKILSGAVKQMHAVQRLCHQDRRLRAQKARRGGPASYAVDNGRRVNSFADNGGYNIGEE